jgi:hypothetical protein
MIPFACLSPLKASQYIVLSLIVQFLTTFLATPVEILQASSGHMNGHTDPSLAN